MNDLEIESKGFMQRFCCVVLFFEVLFYLALCYQMMFLRRFMKCSRMDFRRRSGSSFGKSAVFYVDLFFLFFSIKKTGFFILFFHLFSRKLAILALSTSISVYQPTFDIWTLENHQDFPPFGMSQVWAWISNIQTSIENRESRLSQSDINYNRYQTQ